MSNRLKLNLFEFYQLIASHAVNLDTLALSRDAFLFHPRSLKNGISFTFSSLQKLVLVEGFADLDTVITKESLVYQTIIGQVPKVEVVGQKRFFRFLDPEEHLSSSLQSQYIYCNDRP
jgi:hypothetical protein